MTLLRQEILYVQYTEAKNSNIDSYDKHLHIMRKDSFKTKT